MKAKKIMGVALLAFAVGQLSMAEKTDPNIERLLKVAKQKKAAEEKEARKQELMNSVVEEGEVPVTVSPSISTPTVSGSKKAELEAKRNKEAEARKRKAEAKAMKAKYKNMSESEKMDAEVQRIKKRVDEINSNIETFHKTNAVSYTHLTLPTKLEV